MTILSAKMRYLAAIGCAVSCGASEANGVPAGLVVAPTLASGAVTKAPGDGGADVMSSFAHRALPPEPRAPTSGVYGCQADPRCQPEDDEMPAVPFPPPYEHCLPTGKSNAGFSVQETNKRRQWDPSACCYVGFINCKTTRSMPVPGRPLRDSAGDIVIASPAERSDWLFSLDSVAPDAVRAKEWLDAGAAEHASVAAFARVSLELLALGAPADLLAATHKAALDEIEHARMCYALAVRFGAPASGPGPLPVPPMTAATFEAVAREAMIDGFANEACAAHEARERALAEADPIVRNVLERIAEDEERHAALALRTAKWALGHVPNARALALDAISRLGRGFLARELIAPCLGALV